MQYGTVWAAGSSASAPTGAAVTVHTVTFCRLGERAKPPMEVLRKEGSRTAACGVCPPEKTKRSKQITALCMYCVHDTSGFSLYFTLYVM